MANITRCIADTSGEVLIFEVLVNGVWTAITTTPSTHPTLTVDGVPRSLSVATHGSGALLGRLVSGLMVYRPLDESGDPITLTSGQILTVSVADDWAAIGTAGTVVGLAGATPLVGVGSGLYSTPDPNPSPAMKLAYNLAANVPHDPGALLCNLAYKLEAWTADSGTSTLVRDSKGNLTDLGTATNVRSRVTLSSSIGADPGVTGTYDAANILPAGNYRLEWDGPNDALALADDTGGGTVTQTGGSPAPAKALTMDASWMLTRAYDPAIAFGDFDWTVSFWSTLTSNTATRFVWYSGDQRTSGSGRRNARIVYLGGGGVQRWRAVISQADGTDICTLTLTNAGVPTTNTYQFITIEHDAAAKVMRGYVNGVLTDTSDVYVGTPASASHPIAVGGAYPNPSDLSSGTTATAQAAYWSGLLDQVAKWDRKLTDAERTWLYNSGLGRHSSTWGGADDGANLNTSLGVCYEFDDTLGTLVDSNARANLTNRAPTGTVATAAGLVGADVPVTGNWRTYSVGIPANNYGARLRLRAIRAPFSNVRILPPGVPAVDTPLVHPDLVRMFGSAHAVRFMDVQRINNSNVVDYSDFLDEDRLGHIGIVDRTSRTITAIEPYTVISDPNWSQLSKWYYKNVPYVLTTSTPHGYKAGQVVELDNFATDLAGSGKFRTVAGDDISTGGICPIFHVIDAYRFALRTQLTAPNTNQRTVAQPQAVTAGTVQLGAGQGMHPKQCARMCNELGKNLWICIPHAATDACITSMFADIGAILNPDLDIYVEYSNEHWNFGFAFQQSAWIQGNAQYWLTGGSREVYQAYAYRYSQAMPLARAALQSSAWWAGTGQFQRVLGGQSKYGGAAQNCLNWLSANAPAEIPDCLAIAPYFSLPSNDAHDPMFNYLTAEGRMGIAEWWAYRVRPQYGNVADVNNAHSIWHRNYLDTNGYSNVRLVCYEGGLEYAGMRRQVANSGERLIAARQSHAHARHPRIRRVIQHYLDGQQHAGVSLFVYYHLLGSPGQYQYTYNGGNESPSAYAAMWPVYNAYGQQRGVGDGSDSLYDNRTYPDELDEIVCPIGLAIETWAAGGANPGGVGSPFRVDRQFKIRPGGYLL